ncbi:MAG: glutamyl-tRNA reductase [Sediminibacterium sp.]|nr:glutamyl-tRNA reductase [Sediminibacterium sp.]
MNLHHFYLVGINYKKTDASTRGLFAIDNQDNVNLLNDAKTFGINQIFVLSTCNRTEVYAIADSADSITALLAKHTAGDLATLKQKCYIKKAKFAVQHLFEVGAGLDSQILGDYEIIGQLKNAFKIAKEQQTIDAFLERLFNTVLQASKLIKNNTELSSGTISVSFAAIQYILGNIEEANSKKILLIGTGKIGVNTCKNILDYIHPKNLWVMNRTNEKAQQLSKQINVEYKSYQDLETRVNEADIIVVATNSKEFIIKENSINNNKIRHFIDMSIPNNIDPAIINTQNQQLVNVDDLSKINDITLSIRKAQVPRALEIITEHSAEFYDWHQLRKYAPVLKSLKENLNALHEQAFPDANVKPELVTKIVNKVAANIRTNNHPTCFYMQAVQDFIDQPIFN